MENKKYIEFTTDLNRVYSVDDYISIKNPSDSRKSTYIIGDLHANASKLIYFLFYSGMCLAQEQVQKDIKEAYNNRNYELFKKSLKNVIVHKLNVKNVKLIFIGDSLCDRGKSDFMIMLLYEFLADNGINFTICLSNHDSAFIYQACNFNRKRGALEHVLSPINSFDLYQISQEDQILCLNIFQDIYLPRLNLVTYNICDNNEIICSHAPCNYKIINKLYPEFSNLSLQELIQSVNLKLQNAITNKTFNYKWIEKNCLDFIWNREVEKSRPNGNIINIFGHVGELDIIGINQINLDSNIGKSDRQDRGLLRIYKMISRNAIYYSIQDILNSKRNFMQSGKINIVNIINNVRNASSSFYSTFGSNRKGNAFQTILNICNSMESINTNQMVRVIEILAKVALIPRGKTQKINKINLKTNHNIDQTKSGRALLLEIYKNKGLQYILAEKNIAINNYSDLVVLCGENIRSMYADKQIIYNRVNNLKHELNSML